MEPISQQLEFDEYITPDGVVYSFHDKRSGLDNGRWLMSRAGDGMPEIEYITQRGPFQHGATLLDYRLQPRTITLVHRRRDCDRTAYWQTRAALLNALRPNRQTTDTLVLGRLRKILPDGTTRDIDAMIMGGPEFAARATDSWQETSIAEALRFYCPDPTFYDPTQVVIDLSAVFCDDLIFSFDFPFTFCDRDGNTLTDSVTYAGTWLSYPVITVSGPVSGLLIRNLTTDEKLELNRTIPLGTTITIDLRYGNKSVTDGLGNNLVGYLSTDSDLATWHIAPDPEAPGGVNEISITGFDSTAASAAFISYYTRYIGI